MSTNQKTFLESKLMAFKACYQQAESKKDQKRMDKIEIFLDQIQEEINDLN